MDVILLREEFPTEHQLHQKLNDQSGRSVVNADHTVNLYRVDEALSALQKAIRRSHVEDALYWATELDMSGYHRATMQRLVLIGSEDVALGIPGLPVYMKEIFIAWEDEKKAGWEKEFKARSLIVGLCWTLASGPKSRSACLAAAYAVRAIHNAIQRNSQELGMSDCSACGFAHLQAIKAAAELARVDLKYEEEALMHMQLLMYEGDKWGWERQIWQTLLDFPHTSDLVTQGIRALFEVDQAIEGVERLRVFHALMLYTREKWLHTDYPVPCCPHADDPAFVETLYRHGRHPQGIPWYCVDKHTLRGHGTGQGDIVRGKDTTLDIRKAAKVWQIDISEWSSEELARSHGPGREWPRNRCIGLPTMMSQFMNEGALVEPEAYPGPAPRIKPSNVASIDPMHQLVTEFNLQVEELQGPLTRPSSYVFGLLCHARNSAQVGHFHTLPPHLLTSSKKETGEAGNVRKKKSRVQGKW